MVDKLTKELADKVLEHLDEQRADFDDEETDGAIEIIQENIGNPLSKIDVTLITRTMSDEELINELSECELEEGGNIFG